MPPGNSIPGIYGMQQCSNGVDIVSIEAIALFQEFLSGRITHTTGQILEIRYENTVLATGGLVGFKFPRANIVLNGLNRYP
jgi:hypothetical protein